MENLNKMLTKEKDVQEEEVDHEEENQSANAKEEDDDNLKSSSEEYISSLEDRSFIASTLDGYCCRHHFMP